MAERSDGHSGETSLAPCAKMKRPQRKMTKDYYGSVKKSTSACSVSCEMIMIALSICPCLKDKLDLCSKIVTSTRWLEIVLWASEYLLRVVSAMTGNPPLWANEDESRRKALRYLNDTKWAIPLKKVWHNFRNFYRDCLRAQSFSVRNIFIRKLLGLKLKTKALYS